MRNAKSRRGNQILAAAVGAVGVVGLATVAQAGNTWDGGSSADSNWKTNANWDGDTAPSYSSPLIFAGSTRLSPNNDNTAGTSVAGITFSANAAAFSLTGNSFTLSGDITNNSPNLQTINNAITMSGNRTVAGSGSVTLGTVSVGDHWTVTNRLDAGKVLTFGGTLTTGATGNKTLILAGTGDTTFSDTVTGTIVHVRNRGTTVAAGSLATGASTNGVILSGGGTVKLNYGTNTGSHIADASDLCLVGVQSGGSILNYGGVNLVLDGGSHPEVVASTKFGGYGGGGRGHVNLSRPSGGSTLVMGAFTVSSSFATMNFAENDLASTTTANRATSIATGILNSYATVGGTDWAANSGVPHSSGGNYIRAYTGYTGLPTSGGSYASNYTQNGGATLTGAVGAGTVKLAGSGTLNLGTNNLDVRLGLLYAGTSTYTISGSGYAFYAGTETGTIYVNGGELVFDCGWGGTAARALTKGGQGRLTLQKASSSTGAITVTEGALRLKHNTAAGTTAAGINVAVSAAGSALELEGGITVGAEALTMNGNGISNGGALRNISGSNTYGGAIAIQYQGARINSDLGTLLTLTGGITTGNTDITGDVTFGGAGNILVSTTAITGAGNVIKDGAGTVELSAGNDYTGTTTVSAGKLLVNGTNSGTGAVTVGASGKLGGTGSIAGAVTVAGTSASSRATLAPGASIESLDVTANVVLGAFSKLDVEVDSSAGGMKIDLLNITGNLDLSATTDTLYLSGTLNSGASHTLVAYSGSLTGTFSEVYWNNVLVSSPTTGGIGSGAGYKLDYGDGSADVIKLVEVPEPSSAIGLLASGALMALRRKKRT